MEQAVVTTLTPETRAELRRLAEKATPGGRIALVRTGRNPPPLPPEFAIIAATAPGHGIYATPPGGTYPAADMEFIAACDPETILALLDSSEPVAGGEFEAKLRKLIVDYACLGPATIEELERALDAHDSAFVAVVAAYARLQAERDAAVAEAGRLNGALSVAWEALDNLRKADSRPGHVFYEHYRTKSQMAADAQEAADAALAALAGSTP